MLDSLDSTAHTTFRTFGWVNWLKCSKGRDRGAGATGRQQGHKKRGRSDPGEIDPLDPTGKAGGKWSDGLVQVK